MLTLPPSTSLSVTDSQNNTAPDRMKDNMLKKKINLQYLDITTRGTKIFFILVCIGQQHLHQNRKIFKIAVKNYPADTASDIFLVYCIISMQLEFCIQYPSPMDLEKSYFPLFPYELGSGILDDNLNI